MAENKTGFLIGNSMSLADVAMLDVLLEVEEHYGEEYLKLYPNLKVSCRFVKPFKESVVVIISVVDWCLWIMLH